MDATDTGFLETRYCGCCVVDLYNGHRPHRALGFVPPAPVPSTPTVASDCGAHVHRRDRLGGFPPLREPPSNPAPSLVANGPSRLIPRARPRCAFVGPRDCVNTTAVSPAVKLSSHDHLPHRQGFTEVRVAFDAA